MCKIKKIIAGVLCAIAAGIGVIGINAQTAAAQTAAGQGATAAAGMSLEQLQQIIEMLKQQIQQIIVLLQKRIAQSPVCGNGVCETAKGETAASCAADCEVVSDCAKEGEASFYYNREERLTDGNAVNIRKQCCSGLTEITYYDENATNGGDNMPMFLGTICTKCGDDICGKGENTYNCLRDCGCKPVGDYCCSKDGCISKRTAPEYNSSLEAFDYWGHGDVDRCHYWSCKLNEEKKCVPYYVDELCSGEVQ